MGGGLGEAAGDEPHVRAGERLASPRTGSPRLAARRLKRSPNRLAALAALDIHIGGLFVFQGCRLIKDYALIGKPLLHYKIEWFPRIPF